ncbi:MAG: DUF4340 domain-containing protein [Gammaproteobacteria bacterium]|nr:DUF4340 domain-containing protein [Gammaproteobacteria bacterium]MYF02071.1 DUF4340 domain-containing protein [Gammaproteobacteria bacterium]MYI77093.1 DUF4340 domain-containing protein [Gammaproteobacteria bacterium]
MKQNFLIGLFVVQVLVITLFLVTQSGGVRSPEAFLEFDVAAVDRFVITGTDESIELTKDGEQWVLPDGNPADESKVDSVIGKLADSGADWPVATSQSAAKRFEVTKESFQKQISIYSGQDLLVDLYLGTSPSFRRVHARQANKNDIHSIEFSNFEAGTSPSAWLDKRLLQPSGPIKSFERISAYKLVQEDGTWTTESDAELDESKVRSYMDRFESLSVFELSENELADATTTTQFAIEDDEGFFLLTIYHFDVADDWVAVSDRRGSQYGVASYIGSQLVKGLEDLAPDEPIDIESDLESDDDIEEILIETD